jgi:hypothetical protein
MKMAIGKLALIALCSTAFTVVSQSSQAASFQITGATGVPGAYAGYGTAPGYDNVVNSGTSGQSVTDSTGGATWYATSGANAAYLEVTGLTSGQSYTVKYSYFGSESGDVIQFTAPGVAPYNETNANANCCGVSPQQQIQSMGGSTPITGVTGNSIVNFTLTDTNSGATITNGAGNTGPGLNVANLIFSYAVPSLIPGLGGETTYQLTSTPSDFVVFGFNDNGFRDDNHDDFIGLAQLTVTGGNAGTTPIPGALPLFASALGGGLFFRRFRKRGQAGAQVAAA